jgi:hypothetical protein
MGTALLEPGEGGVGSSVIVGEPRLMESNYRDECCFP